MKKKDFDNIPHRASFCEDIGEFDSLVIIPTGKKHDSGWGCMDFVACIDGKPICRLSGCSDVLNIDGTRGYGQWEVKVPTTVLPKGWRIDCLPCGYLHLWCEYKLKAGAAVSSFDIFASSASPQAVH